MTRLVLGVVILLSSITLSVIAMGAESALINAARTGDRDLVLSLIRQETDVNETSVDGTSALHWAVYNGDVALVERLIRAGAAVSSENDYGSTPMTEASAVANAGILAVLLSAGVDADSPNREGQTALMAVARTGNLDAARMLLDSGADINAAESWGGQTSLMWAASRRHPEMVAFLIENGANIDARALDRDWERRVTSEPRVKELHTGGFTPLLYAVRENCMLCVQNLLEAGADINKPDPDNVSPLILALLNMRFDIAKYLVEQGADINQWDIWGETPLYAATDTNIVPNSARGDRAPLDETKSIEIARMLLERGANPDLQLKLPPLPRNIVNDRAGDYQGLNAGTTPLQRAAYGGDIAIMKLLLEYDANVELKNVNGMGPIFSMAGPGGSRGGSKTEDKVAEGLALLFAAGADVNERNNRGETALHVATRSSWKKVVQVLAANGADLDATDARGFTAMDHAKGAADSVGFGNYDGVVGNLPEMIALLTELKEAR